MYYPALKRVHRLQRPADVGLYHLRGKLSKLMKIIQEAITLKDQPLYRQLEGDIYFTMGIYELAYESYTQVNESEVASPASFYWAAKAKEQIPGTNIGDLIVLLDSAIVRAGPEPTAETLAYLLERIDYKMKLTLYDDVICITKC